MLENITPLGSAALVIGLILLGLLLHRLFLCSRQGRAWQEEPNPLRIVYVAPTVISTGKSKCYSCEQQAVACATNGCQLQPDESPARYYGGSAIVGRM